MVSNEKYPLTKGTIMRRWLVPTCLLLATWVFLGPIGFLVAFVVFLLVHDSTPKLPKK